MTNERKEKFLALLEDKLYIPSRADEIRSMMDVPQDESGEFDAMVDELVRGGYAVVTKKGKLQSTKRLGLYRGMFRGNARGYGFVSVDGLEDDIFIPAPAVGGAMHKDTVLVRLREGQGGERLSEGEVVSVIERGMSRIVGTFSEAGRGNGFVTPDDKRLPQDIYIAKGNSRNAVDGHKVLVKLTRGAEEGKRGEGEVTEIIGHENAPGVDILSIVLQNGVPCEFPKTVMREAEKTPVIVEPAEFAGREDFRGQLVITIDGADAKDLDDAVSLRVLENGNYELSVHIADVCAYVKEGSEIDKEAYKRGTSVYLVDRVIPMLPHVLSNGICSLNPNESRLTLSCVMELDSQAKVVGHRITEGIIVSKYRMTYDDVNEIITDENSPLREEYAEITPMLLNMDGLRQKLFDARVRRGAIDFGMKETKVLVDENGKPTGIEIRERNNATSLIEEFMLICNETVAENFFWAEAPFVYRTHEEPDEEKLAKLAALVVGFGHRLKGRGLHPKAIQELLLSLQGKPEEAVISRLTLRSLKQARYTPACEGHFGLAAKYYTHFTSPIRRYPDLQIHRIIKLNLHGELGEAATGRLDGALPEICRHCSVTERRAEETEREADNLKKVEYMEDKVGNGYEGIVSGVTGWGIYVELHIGVEGMIPLNELDDDFYIFNEAEMRVVGKSTKKSYGLGDKLNIIVAKADKQNRRLDFALAD